MLAAALAGCAASGPPVPPPGARTAVLQPGQSLYDVARSFNVPLRDLIEVNSLRAPFFVQPGGVLILPTTREHFVQQGETIAGVAQRFGISESEIARLNHLDPPYRLLAGQRLRLPGPPGGMMAEAPGNIGPGGGDPAGLGAAAPGAAGAVTRETLAPLAPVPPASSPAPGAPPQVTAALPPAPPSAGGHRFRWPLNGPIVAGFGQTAGGTQNDGINIEAAQGTPILAAADGTVAYAGNELRGYGNLVLLRHEDGWVTAYAHAERILVRVDQEVTAGDPVATVGSTGTVTSPQLHFEVRRGVEPVNPLDHLPPRPGAAAGTGR